MDCASRCFSVLDGFTVIILVNWFRLQRNVASELVLIEVLVETEEVIRIPVLSRGEQKKISSILFQRHE